MRCKLGNMEYPLRLLVVSLEYPPPAKEKRDRRPGYRRSRSELNRQQLPGSSVAHLVARQSELLEVLLEASGEIGGGAVEVVFVGPGVARDEQVGWHIRATGGDAQAKDRIGDRLHAVQRAADGGPYHSAGIVDIDARTDAIGAARPAGVQQVAAHVVPLDALAQQIGVFAGTQGQERRAKARAEGRFRRR